jgi:putative addiction module component
MSEKPPFPPPGFEELSADEQIDYLNALWELIVSKPDAVKVPDWHLEIAEERLRRLESGVDEGIPAEEVDKKLDELEKEFEKELEEELEES